MARLLPPGPVAGLWAPVRGLGFIAGHARLWWLCLAPFLINLGLFVLGFWLTFGYFQSWVQGMLPTGEGWWWQVLLYLLMVVAVLLLLIVEVYLFAVVGRIIAAPFLEELTRRVEMLARPGHQPPDMGFWTSVARALSQEAKRLALYLAVMLGLLVLNLLPGLGSLAYGVLAWLATCFFLAGEFLDFPLERRGWGLMAKMGYVLRLRLTGLGFGLAVFALGVVPVVNLALLPLAAVGGTLLYLERPPDPGHSPKA
jgi:CysZ protein